MKKISIGLFFCLFIASFFVACSGKLIRQPALSTFTPESTRINTTVTEYVPEYPPAVNIFESTEPVTDGRLLLSIKEVESSCHQMSVPIQIRLIFQNLTGEILLLPTRFATTPAVSHIRDELFPILTTEDGKLLSSLLDYSNPWVFEPIGLVEIPENDQYKIVIDYDFPKSVPSINNQRVTPSPGRYKIRFLYDSVVYFDPTRIWTGSIASNQIEFCVIE